MNEPADDPLHEGLEERARILFKDSVDALDMRIRSRLTQARHAALEAAEKTRRRPWFLRPTLWAPATGLMAMVLGAALWLGTPLSAHLGMSPQAHSAATADNQANLEDLEIVASTDEGSADPMEMLQDDLEFYDFADKAASAGPAA